MSEFALAADESALVAELRKVGLSVQSVYDLVNTASPYPEAYPVLVKHLHLSHLANIREGVIRALTVKDAGATVTEALMEEFQKEASPILKWVLANALKTTMPYKERRLCPEIREVFDRGAAP
jgi:hypothetical protein